jgi:hypothetical protein
MSEKLQESFRELLSRTSIENELELNYWQGKFRGKIPKSVKHRMEKLKYILSLQYDAMKQKEEQKQKQKESANA